jgi:hypothetical protein
MGLHSPAPTGGVASRTPRRLRQIVVVVVVSVAASWLLHARPERSLTSAPAGLAQGMWDGAIMPLALPKLLLGQDAAIYAVNNTGRTYHIGYILGVNVCGLVFFGAFFGRLRAWRESP